MKKMEEENTMVGSHNRSFIKGFPVRAERIEGVDQGGFQATLQHEGEEREHADPSGRQEEGFHPSERRQRLALTSQQNRHHLTLIIKLIIIRSEIKSLSHFAQLPHFALIQGRAETSGSEVAL